MGKCKYCKWWRLDPRAPWTSECTNENSEWCGEECVEKDRKEPRECDDKKEVECDYIPR